MGCVQYLEHSRNTSFPESFFYTERLLRLLHNRNDIASVGKRPRKIGRSVGKICAMFANEPLLN